MTYALVSVVLIGSYVVIVVVPSLVFAFNSDLLVAAAHAGRRGDLHARYVDGCTQWSSAASTALATTRAK